MENFRNNVLLLNTFQLLCRFYLYESPFGNRIEPISMPLKTKKPCSRWNYRAFSYGAVIQIRTGDLILTKNGTRKRDRLKTTKCIHINTLKHFTHPPFWFLSLGWNSFLKEIINRKSRDVHIEVAILLKKKKRKTSTFLPFQKIQRTSEIILPLTYIIPLKRFSDSSEVILESLEYTRIIRVI